MILWLTRDTGGARAVWDRKPKLDGDVWISSSKADFGCVSEGTKGFSVLEDMMFKTFWPPNGEFNKITVKVASDE